MSKWIPPRGKSLHHLQVRNVPKRGMHRYHLDFEASEGCSRNVGSTSLKPVSLISRLGASGTSLGSNTTSVPLMLYERAATYDCAQCVPKKGETCTDTERYSQSSSAGRFSFLQKTPDFTSGKAQGSTQSNGNSSVSVGMPSGIGLHLNSLATTMSLGFGVSVQTLTKGSVSMQGMMPLSCRKEASLGQGSSLLSASSGGNLSSESRTNPAPGMVVSIMEKSGNDHKELQSTGNAEIGVTKSTSCLRSLKVGIKLSEDSLPFSTVESVNGKRRELLHNISLQSARCMRDEFKQTSPKRKRRKSGTITEKGGCKRCNCKRSKCLKLYCDCFAAGVYCIESCTCQGCFNKPDHEDMVLGTRRRIEARDPLAFAPKIIQDADSPLANREECSETPPSIRHKRGCNCKRSMCLKKYCECFQSGVGCSEGCKCEGCKNMYGKNKCMPSIV